jgi:hypothetical protein
MPLIVNSNKLYFFQNLNALTISDVKDYEIVNEKRKVLYDKSGRFGVIKVIMN